MNVYVIREIEVVQAYINIKVVLGGGVDETPISF